MKTILCMLLVLTQGCATAIYNRSVAKDMTHVKQMRVLQASIQSGPTGTEARAGVDLFSFTDGTATSAWEAFWEKPWQHTGLFIAEMGAYYAGYKSYAKNNKDDNDKSTGSVNTGEQNLINIQATEGARVEVRLKTQETP
jgi:hypothetical protein